MPRYKALDNPLVQQILNVGLWNANDLLYANNPRFFENALSCEILKPLAPLLAISTKTVRSR